MKTIIFILTSSLIFVALCFSAMFIFLKIKAFKSLNEFIYNTNLENFGSFMGGTLGTFVSVITLTYLIIDRKKHENHYQFERSYMIYEKQKVLLNSLESQLGNHTLSANAFLETIINNPDDIFKIDPNDIKSEETIKNNTSKLIIYLKFFHSMTLAAYPNEQLREIFTIEQRARINLMIDINNKFKPKSDEFDKSYDLKMKKIVTLTNFYNLVFSKDINKDLTF